MTLPFKIDAARAADAAHQSSSASAGLARATATREPRATPKASNSRRGGLNVSAVLPRSQRGHSRAASYLRNQAGPRGPRSAQAPYSAGEARTERRQSGPLVFGARGNW